MAFILLPDHVYHHNISGVNIKSNGIFGTDTEGVSFKQNKVEMFWQQNHAILCVVCHTIYIIDYLLSLLYFIRYDKEKV